MRVLIIDDTKTLLSLIQVYLMGWGLEFVEAMDGKEGLRKVQETHPDLIISDIRMPRMDGFELCAAIRKHEDFTLRKVPIVLLTALKDDVSRQKGKLLGATAFLTKPVSVDELRSTVSTVLNLPVRK